MAPKGKRTYYLSNLIDQFLCVGLGVILHLKKIQRRIINSFKKRNKSLSECWNERDT